MFNPTLIAIEAFIRELPDDVSNEHTGILEPDHPTIISFAAELALENIASSDAADHDVKSHHDGHACRTGNSAWETYQRRRSYSARLAEFHPLAAMS